MGVPADELLVCAAARLAFHPCCILKCWGPLQSLPRMQPDATLQWWQLIAKMWLVVAFLADVVCLGLAIYNFLYGLKVDAFWVECMVMGIMAISEV